jgi:lipoprotein-anchoring transpeptidase ErfK/SrfK
VIAVEDDFPAMDRIHQLFTTGPSKLPIVETVTYSSNVPWLKGRPAWIADYAAHYQTSRHFIARSLNGKPDYFTQKVSTGNRFNVFRLDKNIQFYLLIDVSLCKMGFYYVDLGTQERVLLKTYRVGLGRSDPTLSSQTLTPLGKFTLGDKVAIYKPGIMGLFRGQRTEMVRVFGTRWLPFAHFEEAGYGIHGAPWKEENGTFVENIGTYDSDGCIRLSAQDIEELFAIVITKPTFVEIVKDFHEAKLPGKEVAVPTHHELRQSHVSP